MSSKPHSAKGLKEKSRRDLWHVELCGWVGKVNLMVASFVAQLGVKNTLIIDRLERNFERQDLFSSHCWRRTWLIKRRCKTGVTMLDWGLEDELSEWRIACKIRCSTEDDELRTKLRLRDAETMHSRWYHDVWRKTTMTIDYSKSDWWSDSERGRMNKDSFSRRHYYIFLVLILFFAT